MTRCEAGPQLAPFYDVLAMALAPPHSELPDAYLTGVNAPPAPEVRPWVEQLIQRVEADVEISAGFKDVWRRYLGVYVDEFRTAVMEMPVGTTTSQVGGKAPSSAD